MLEILRKLFSAPVHDHPIFGEMKYDGIFWKSDLVFPLTQKEIFVLVEGKKEVLEESKHKEFWESLNQNYKDLLTEIIPQIKAAAESRFKRSFNTGEVELGLTFTDIYVPNSMDQFTGWTMGFVFEKTGFNAYLNNLSVSKVESL